MNDSWIPTLGALLLIVCCLLLETGLVGGTLAAGLAALGYTTTGLIVGGVTIGLLVIGWKHRRRRFGEHRARDA